jgi:hypothetical protein
VLSPPANLQSVEFALKVDSTAGKIARFRKAGLALPYRAQLAVKRRDIAWWKKIFFFKKAKKKIKG